MRCIFAGVGEAFDALEPNTSLIIEHDGASLLLDCGFTAGHGFFRHASDPMALDAVNLSHFHGDHFFGLPALLIRFVEQGRTKPLAVIGREGVENRVMGLLEAAYPGSFARAAFVLDFLDSAPGVEVNVAGFALSFALSDHSVPNLAVRVERGGKALFYSGDGRPTERSTALAAGCGLAVHEAYSLEPEARGHGTVDGCLDFARTAGTKALALVHVRREVRRARKAEILDRLGKAEGFAALLPEAGDVIDL